MDPVKTLLTGGGNYFHPLRRLLLSELRWFLVNCSIFTEEAKGLGLRSERVERREEEDGLRGHEDVLRWRAGFYPLFGKRLDVQGDVMVM